MPVPTHLLERAYQLINANQFQNAELVLDAVVRVDPQNVDAWMTYLMIHQSQNGLNWLKERILKTKELSEANKTKLVNYYLYLTKQLNGAEEVGIRTTSFDLLIHEESEEITATEETACQFELIDVFDYPAKLENAEINSKPRPRSRRRAVYNPFAFDITGSILKAASKLPFGKQITIHIQKMITLVNDLAKNPMGVYKNFSKSPHFEKYTEVALLGLFFLSIRLVISSHFVGYILLGMFFFGGRWWLMKFGNHSTISQVNQSRVYLHENNDKLPTIKEVDLKQDKRSEKDKPEGNIK